MVVVVMKQLYLIRYLEIIYPKSLFFGNLPAIHQNELGDSCCRKAWPLSLSFRLYRVSR